MIQVGGETPPRVFLPWPAGAHPPPPSGDAPMPVCVDKEIIAPGAYHTADGLVRATPSRIRHWYEQGRKMLVKRLQVPLPWEHQDDAKPQKQGDRLAQRCQHNAGFLR